MALKEDRTMTMLDVINNSLEGVINLIREYWQYGVVIFVITIIAVVVLIVRKAL